MQKKQASVVNASSDNRTKITDCSEHITADDIKKNKRTKKKTWLSVAVKNVNAKVESIPVLSEAADKKVRNQRKDNLILVKTTPKAVNVDSGIKNNSKNINGKSDNSINNKTAGGMSGYNVNNNKPVDDSRDSDLLYDSDFDYDGGYGHDSESVVSDGGRHSDVDSSEYSEFWYRGSDS